MRRRTLYGSNKIESKPIEEANYADICFVNNDTLEKVIVSADKIDDSFPTEDYTPIGIVAVPSSHTDNQRPRIMSIVHMNCDTLESGSTEIQFMDWGETNTAVNELAQKQGYPYIGTSNTSVTTNASVQFTTSYFFLPSDANGENGIENFIYENPSNSNEHFYYNVSGDRVFYMCSPYKEDGSKDTRYFDTSNTGNVLADFDGKSNTDKIISYRGSKDYSTWKPTYNNGADYPAASCCDMFYTVGTNQGDWYLPSAGEMGYVMVRKKSINNSLKELNKKWYYLVSEFDYDYEIVFHTSTHNSNYNYSDNIHINFNVTSNIGIVFDFSKTYSRPVRAFYQL